VNYVIFLLVLLIGGTYPVLAWAEMPLIPQTGQTTSYGARDDGMLQKGVIWPSPRFIDNSNGTVSDNLTGLIWLKNANCFGSLTWSAALAAANTLAGGSCALTDGSTAGDWRIPNRREIKSLVNRQQTDNSSWLNSVGLSNSQADYYWSSSTVANATTTAWRLNLLNGYVSTDNKLNNAFVWPVRGGK
jgi:hypothetical protein